MSDLPLVITSPKVGTVTFPNRKEAVSFHEGLERQFRCQQWGLVRLELPNKVLWVRYEQAQELAKRLGEALSET